MRHRRRRRGALLDAHHGGAESQDAEPRAISPPWTAPDSPPTNQRIPTVSTLTQQVDLLSRSTRNPWSQLVYVKRGATQSCSVNRFRCVCSSTSGRKTLSQGGAYVDDVPNDESRVLTFHMHRSKGGWGTGLALQVSPPDCR